MQMLLFRYNGSPCHEKKINERNLLVGILKLSLILIEYMPVF